MELFTLGIGNYTEDDVKEAARAFTGWPPRETTSSSFRRNQHDDEHKTFLGRRPATSTPTTSCAILVRQPATARFLARKLFRFFVYDDARAGGRSIAWRHVHASSGSTSRAGRGDPALAGVLVRASIPRADQEPVELVVGSLKALGVTGAAAGARCCGAWARICSTRPT